MTLSRQDFGPFFSAINQPTGAPGSASVVIRPFAWQERLLDHLLEHGAWPGQISAPTGSGKSAVVDVHVFANALAAVGAAPRLPRRLSVVVNRRALVDSQFLRAEHIRVALADATDGVLYDVAEALRSQRGPCTWAVSPPEGEPRKIAHDFLKVTDLRGGVAPARDWLDHPEICQVIAATPDMWGSRLLFRGYGSRPQARPREAGLLAYDSVVVVDEAHLNRQLLCTARRVAELESTSPRAIGLPVLQVVETTATPAAGATSAVGVVEADLAPDGDTTLIDRLTRPKPVQYMSTSAWSPTKPTTHYVDVLVTQVTGLCASRAPDDGAVGCVVNRVDTAVRTAQALRAQGLSVELWVGRRRPVDVAELLQAHPELFAGRTASAALDVLVATQTVEVGIDLDLVHLVTELAPASALAQRAGRVNRTGRRAAGRLVVVGPEPVDVSDTTIYSRSDLQAAIAWLDCFENEPSGMSPWAIRSSPPPAQTLARTLLERPELYTASDLAITSERLFEPDDLTLFLRDDLDADQLTSGVVLRSIPEGLGSEAGFALMRATPPTNAETFVGRLSLVREIAERARTQSTACIYRSGEVLALAGETVAPGDVLMIAEGLPCTRDGVLIDDPDPLDRPVPRWGNAIRVATGDDLLCRELSGLDAEEAQQRYDELHRNTPGQVVLPPIQSDDEALPWVVIRDAAAQLDAEVMQETVLAAPVSLEQHQANVAGRAEILARVTGVDEGLGPILSRAGLWHDEGKRDHRFQRRLGREPNGPHLAKSGRRNAQQARRDAAASGLRSGWRHEQLSAAVAFARAGNEPADLLTVRLVGTSHGHGRREFEPPTSQLVCSDTPADVVGAAEQLFGPDAGWHAIVAGTEDEWGLWGCAYLEAIVRAADCQVSGEGS